MSELFTEVLGIPEVNRLIVKAKGHGIKELFLLGFNSGIDLGEAIALPVTQFKGGKQEIILPDRTVVVPKKVVDALEAYAQKRRIKGKTTLWDFNDLAHAAQLYQQETYELIGKPISWKSVRRSYLWHGSGAGLPREFLLQNTGVAYKYAEPWFQNGKNYAQLVNEIDLYKEKR